MSSDPQTPVELSFGTAYDRLHQIAAELGANEALPPEQLIALLREGKGLERALRDHLDRVEQEVREIDEGDGAASFRISDGTAAPSASAAPAAPQPSAAPPEPVAPRAPAVPPAPAAPAAPVAPEPPVTPQRPAAVEPSSSPSSLPSAGDEAPPAAPSFFDADILGAPAAAPGTPSTDDGSRYDDDLPF